MPATAGSLGSRSTLQVQARRPQPAGLHGQGKNQFGQRTAVFPAAPPAAALLAPDLDQSAYAVIAQVGYSWPKGTPWSPRLAVYASIASGDSNAADTKRDVPESFPSKNLLYGAMDLTDTQNARDLRFSLTTKPNAKLTLNLEVNFQALDTADDYWYNAAGAPRKLHRRGSRG